MVVTKFKLTVGSLLFKMQLFSLYNFLLSSINYAWHVQSLVQNEQNLRILWYKLTLVLLLPGEALPPASANTASALKS